MERYRNDREKGFLEIRGEFRVRLAEAEAREGSVLGDWFDWPPPPNVSEVLAWREDSGVFPAQVCVVYEGDGERDWFTYGGRESLYGYLPTKWRPYPTAPGKASAPTAAEVIAAAEKALGPIGKNADEAERLLNEGWVEKHQHIANKLQFGDVVEAKSALAAIAKWKEAQNA